MITRKVTFFSSEVEAGCDARCDKAWGINNRPRPIQTIVEEKSAMLKEGFYNIPR